jgi:pilus assembly protein Flp/PilA
VELPSATPKSYVSAINSTNAELYEEIKRKKRAMANTQSFASSFFKDDSGQDLIEYALIAALLGLGAVASTQSLATSIGNAFTGIGTTLTSSV